MTTEPTHVVLRRILGYLLRADIVQAYRAPEARALYDQAIAELVGLAPIIGERWCTAAERLALKDALRHARQPEPHGDATQPGAGLWWATVDGGAVSLLCRPVDGTAHEALVPEWRRVSMRRGAVRWLAPCLAPELLRGDREP